MVLGFLKQPETLKPFNLLEREWTVGCFGVCLVSQDHYDGKPKHLSLYHSIRSRQLLQRI